MKELNFGYLNEIFKQAISRDINNKKTAQLFKEYVNLIKNTPILKEQFYLYKNIDEVIPSEKLNEYINENLNIIKNKFKPSEIVEGNMKLCGLLYEHLKEKQTVIESPLFESINYVLTTDKKINNINKINEKISLIESCVREKNCVENDDEECDNEELVMNDDEEELFNTIGKLNADEFQNVFESEVKAVLALTNKLLTESTDIELKEKLLMVKENLLESNFNEASFIEDFISLRNLRKNIE